MSTQRTRDALADAISYLRVRQRALAWYRRHYEPGSYVVRMAEASFLRALDRLWGIQEWDREA